MASVWKFVALLFVVTVLVGLATLWRWHAQSVDPSGVDLLVNLLALPVLLTATLTGALWATTRLRRHAFAPLPAASTPAAAPASGAAAAAAAPDDAGRAFFHVHAQAVTLRAGADWDTAHAAIVSGECRPALDATLRDDTGVALFTAALADLDTQDMLRELDPLLAARVAQDPATWRGFTVPEDLVRALSAMSSCLVQVDDPLSVHLTACRLAARDPAARTEARLLVALPAAWSEPSRLLAGDWIASRLSAAIEAGASLQIHAETDGSSTMQRIDLQLADWHRAGRAGLLLAVAADSAISEVRVQAAAERRQLFTGRQQDGRVPGEAAAAVLLSTHDVPAPEATPPLRWHRLATAARATSADTPGRRDAQALQQAARAALAAAALDAAQVSRLSTEIDHRLSRTQELFDATQGLALTLDTTADVLRLGVGCGDLGIAGALASAALAAGKAATEARAGLVLSAAHPTTRAALVLSPPPPPEPSSAASAAT